MFGQEGKDRGLKEVFELEIESLDRKQCVKLEAYAVQSISSIKMSISSAERQNLVILKGYGFQMCVRVKSS